MTHAAEFGSLMIAYDGDVLAPRPWTQQQSAWGVELSGELPDGDALELCCGVGQIGLLMICMQPRRLVMVDVDERAGELARRNARRADLDDLVDIRIGEMEVVLADDERFVLVLADPPWVPSDETAQHSNDPDRAINGGEDGLDLARRCCEVIGRHLSDDGAAILQLGSAGQAAAIGDYVDGRDDLALALAETRIEAGGVLVKLVRPSSHGVAPSA